MPRNQEELARLVAERGLSERVVAAFRRVDRARFVPKEWRDDAYRDSPIPLPGGQTTSQPTLIAAMIDSVEVGPDDTVLEVGAGYGFQTALLAELAGRVVGLERDPELAGAARRNLGPIEGVEIVVGDGWEGLPESAPFDAIVVSATAEELPEALADQLAEGGRMVIPLRSRWDDEVWLLTKKDGSIQRVRLLSPARFVPLVRDPNSRK